MTEEYIDSHYDEIIGHESDIESRLIAEDCSPGLLKESNRRYIDMFEKAGDKTILTDDNYNNVLSNDIFELLDKEMNP